MDMGKSTGYVYQPEYSFFYEPTVFYDDGYDFSDFEGVWLADEDNLYENCYIEFDWDGNWYLNVAGETIDQGYLLHDSVWDCIYVECLWDSAIADGEAILDGDLLYIDTLGYFEHLNSEDETDEYDEYYNDEEFAKELDKFLFFAGNGCGDYYCYHANADGVIDEASIYIWEHEEYCWKQVASNMAELLTRYYHDEI